MRGLKLLSFCHFKSLIVFQYRYSIGGWEIWKPRVKFKHRYWFFADTPNIAGNYSVIWKDIWWTADSYRHFEHRWGCTLPMFQFSVWCEKCDAARHCAVIGKQLLILNDRNRVRWAVLGLSQDGECTDSFENLSVKSLKRDQSNDTKFYPPLFPLFNTFNGYS